MAGTYFLPGVYNPTAHTFYQFPRPVEPWTLSLAFRGDVKEIPLATGVQVLGRSLGPRTTTVRGRACVGVNDRPSTPQVIALWMQTLESKVADVFWLCWCWHPAAAEYLYWKACTAQKFDYTLDPRGTGADYALDVLIADPTPYVAAPSP